MAAALQYNDAFVRSYKNSAAAHGLIETHIQHDKSPHTGWMFKGVRYLKQNITEHY